MSGILDRLRAALSGRRATVDPSTLFDPDWYAATSGETGTPAELWEHYRAEGDARGVSPSPYVDPSFYRERYGAPPGGRTMVEDLLVHLARGDARDPHPLISEAEYLHLNPDVAAAGIPALLHLVQNGEAELRSPSHRFDSRFYARTYLPLEATHPLRHYLEHGRAKGFLPVPGRHTPSEAAELSTRLCPDDGRTVVLVGHDAQPGGAPYVQQALAEELQSRGWRPVVWLLRGGAMLEHWRSRWPVVVLEEGWPSSGLLDGLPAGTPVLTSTALTAPLAASAASAGHPTVTVLHETGPWISRAGLLSACWDAARAGVRLAVLFPRVRDQLLADVPTGLAEQLSVIRFGLFARLADDAAVQARRAELSADGAGPVLIGAGLADERKGFDLWLEAARALTRRSPGARFVWLGDLTAWAQELLDRGAADGIDLVLPGHVTDATAWYAASDAFLLTSRRDPGPTVVMDAAHAGIPFVAYDTDLGIRGIAEPVGTFVPEGAVDAYVTAVLGTLAGESEERRRWRTARVEQEISFAGFVDDQLALAGLPRRPGDDLRG